MQVDCSLIHANVLLFAQDGAQYTDRWYIVRNPFLALLNPS